MTCAWKELLAVLPVSIRKDVQKQEKTLREIRLRINSPPELVCADKRLYLEGCVSREDLSCTVNLVSKYSPWAAATAAKGYLTAVGGHRIGICGDTVIRDGTMTGFGIIRSLCIRVARDFPGIAQDLSKASGSVLILGAPGWGKTTLLRDLVRQLCRKETVCVVDERGELFPEELDTGHSADVLRGCPKKTGIPMLLRTMGPDSIAVDEITEPEDVQALIRAANCGVRLLATAHSASTSDFRSRPVYRPLLEHNIFQTLAVLNRNNTYHLERIGTWHTDGLVQL